jgi:hypothetical protein
MKLELKHLAPYLPYGLKVVHKLDSSIIYELNYYLKVKGNRFRKDHWTIEEVLEYGKPILRPLSDFIGEEDIVDEMTHNELLMMGNNIDLVERLSYDVVKLMFKNHFDVFGLIGKGLAININTLEK